MNLAEKEAGTGNYFISNFSVRLECYYNQKINELIINVFYTFQEIVEHFVQACDKHVT